MSKIAGGSLALAAIAWSSMQLGCDSSAPPASGGPASRPSLSLLVEPENLETPHTLVILLRAPLSLDAAALQRRAEEAWGIPAGEGAEALLRVLGSPPGFIVNAPPHSFLVHVVGVPFGEELKSSARAVHDEALRTALLSHTAWVGIEPLDRPERANRSDHYQKIGTLLAALADYENAVGVFCPNTHQCAPYSPKSREALVSPNPFTVFK